MMFYISIGNYLEVGADGRINEFYRLIDKHEETLTTRRDTGFTKFLAFFKAGKWFQKKFGVATTDDGSFVSKARNQENETLLTARNDDLSI